MAATTATREAEALREHFLARAAAHNKAVLAIVVACVLAALGILAATPFLAAGRPWVAAPAVLLAGAILGRGLRFHGRVIRDLGPGRRFAAEVALALREGGARPRGDGAGAGGGGYERPVGELEAVFAREDLLRGLDFLGRLGLAWAEPRPEGDVVVVAPRAFEIAT